MNRRVALIFAVLLLGIGALLAAALFLKPADGEAVAQESVLSEAPPPAIEEPGLPLLRARLASLAAGGQFMGAVLIAQDDRILLREAYGMADIVRGRRAERSDRYRLASVSKQFTAAAILRLQDQGLLTVDDLVCRWFDPCPTGWEDIRLSHLMSHTSGLPDLMDRPNWGELRQTPMTLDQLTAETMGYRPRFPPGTRADYNNAGFNLLADVVERVSGLPYEAFLQREFFTPLGMANTGSDADAAGHGVVEGHNQTSAGPVPGPTPNVSIIPGAGALYSTIDDMLTWQRALHGGRVLSAESYRQMIADHAPADQGLAPGARPRGWGYGLFTGDLASGADPAFRAEQIYHTGSWAGFRNLVTHTSEDNVSVIVLSNNYHQRDAVFLIAQQAIAETIGAPFPTGLQE